MIIMMILSTNILAGTIVIGYLISFIMKYKPRYIMKEATLITLHFWKFPGVQSVITVTTVRHY